MNFTVMSSHMCIIILHSFSSPFLPIHGCPPPWPSYSIHSISLSYSCLPLSSSLTILFLLLYFTNTYIHIYMYVHIFNFSFWIWKTMKYLLMSLILHRVIIRSSTVVLQVVHFHSPLQLKIVSCMYLPRFFYSIHQSVGEP